MRALLFAVADELLRLLTDVATKRRTDAEAAEMLRHVCDEATKSAARVSDGLLPADEVADFRRVVGARHLRPR